MASERKGGRKPTGTVGKTRDGRLQAIITLADGSRKRLKPFPVGTSEAYAKERAEFWAGEAIRRGLVRTPPKAEPSKVQNGEHGESIADYIGRLFEHRAVRGLKRQPVERGRLRNHIEPTLAARGVQTMQAVSIDDCRAIVEVLDQKIADDELEASSAGKAWAIWKTVCVQACGSKVAALRVRDTDPCAGVKGPEGAERKAKQ